MRQYLLYLIVILFSNNSYAQLNIGKIIQFPSERNYTTLHGNDSLILLYDWTSTIFQVVNLKNNEIIEYEFKHGKGPLEIQEVNDSKIVENYIVIPDSKQAKLVLINLLDNSLSFEIAMRFPYDKIAYNSFENSIYMFSTHNKKMGILNLSTLKIDNKNIDLPNEYIIYHENYNFDATDGYPFIIGNKIYSHIFKYPKIIELQTFKKTEFKYAKKEVNIKNVDIRKGNNASIIRSNVVEFKASDFSVFKNNYVIIVAKGEYDKEVYSNNGVYIINIKNSLVNYLEMPSQIKGVHCNTENLYYLTIENSLEFISFKELNMN